jgi:hypothetical protein
MDKKEAYLFCKFLEVERQKIDLDKYYEGERQHCDPGQEYIVDWINRNAANWREEWNESTCKDCQHWKVCGHLVRKECREYTPEEN